MASPLTVQATNSPFRPITMATFAAPWNGEACDPLRSTQTNAHSALYIIKIMGNGCKEVMHVLY